MYNLCLTDRRAHNKGVNPLMMIKTSIRDTSVNIIHLSDRSDMFYSVGYQIYLPSKRVPNKGVNSLLSCWPVHQNGMRS